MSLSLIQIQHWILTLPRTELFFYVLLPPVNEFPECPQALSYCLSFMWSLEEMEALSLYRDLTVLPSITEHPIGNFSGFLWYPHLLESLKKNCASLNSPCHLTLYLEWLIKTSGLILLISYLKASAPDKQMVSCQFLSFHVSFWPCDLSFLLSPTVLLNLQITQVVPKVSLGVTLFPALQLSL